MVVISRIREITATEAFLNGCSATCYFFSIRLAVIHQTLYEFAVEWSGVANFYALLHSDISLTDSASKILQQHSTPKYSETNIRFDKKFKPIFMKLK